MRLLTPAPGSPEKRLRELLPVGLATVSYLVIASIAAAMNGNAEFVLYILFLLAMCGGIIIIHLHVGFSAGVLWALSFWALAHMAGGLTPVPESWPINGDQRVLYSLWLIPGWLKYDHVVHAYGFAVATAAAWEALRGTLRVAVPTTGTLIVVVLAGMGLGALNEIVEFFAVLLIPETNVGGYMNTGWDLVSNTVGAVTAAVVIRIREGKSARVKRR